ncbi:MAG: hypothetical protein DCC49_13675, partial [Acidobacteria bacterium]
RVSEQVHQPFRYAGYRYEDGFDLYYLRARWMDPNTGRFLSRDPLRGDGVGLVSLNRYAYAEGSPATLSDPSGLSSREPNAGPAADCAGCSSWIGCQLKLAAGVCDAVAGVAENVAEFLRPRPFLPTIPGQEKLRSPLLSASRYLRQFATDLRVLACSYDGGWPTPQEVCDRLGNIGLAITAIGVVVTIVGLVEPSKALTVAGAVTTLTGAAVTLATTAKCKLVPR